MRVLITNDDGVRAPGLAALAARLTEGGCDVVVAAPIGDRSGSGAALGAVSDGTIIRSEDTRLPLCLDIRALALDAPPAMIAHAYCSGSMGKRPDAVVSGINDGHNTGRGVLHSGTVGAALTAASLGVPSIAVSTGHLPAARFDTAAAVALVALGLLGELEGIPMLNLNVPNLGLAELRGVREGRPVGPGSSDVAYERGPSGITVRKVRDLHNGDASSDTSLVRAGYVSASLLGQSEVSIPVGFLRRLASGLKEASRRLVETS
jgi:5'-nucleotidase